MFYNEHYEYRIECPGLTVAEMRERIAELGRELTYNEMAECVNRMIEAGQIVMVGDKVHHPSCRHR